MSQPTQNNNHAGMTPGEWLKQARAKAAIPIEQVAKELNLDIRKIEAIEASRFAELGAPVYAKGYLRKYARLVNVPEIALLQRYETYGGAPLQADPVPASMGTIPEPRLALPRWVWRLLLALIAVAAAAALWNMRTQSGNVTTSSAASEIQSAATTVDESSPLESLPATAPTAPGPGQITVSFKFSADSWVEVNDANNQQVLYEMGAAGSSRAINARPPLRVVLGSASAVVLQVNAKSVAVPTNHVDANVARFVVNASGVIE
jgi:cytoskeleton protein RodZ